MSVQFCIRSGNFTTQSTEFCKERNILIPLSSQLESNSFFTQREPEFGIALVERPVSERSTFRIPYSNVGNRLLFHIAEL